MHLIKADGNGFECVLFRVKLNGCLGYLQTKTQTENMTCTVLDGLHLIDIWPKV